MPGPAAVDTAATALAAASAEDSSADPGAFSPLGRVGAVDAACLVTSCAARGAVSGSTTACPIRKMACGQPPPVNAATASRISTTSMESSA